MYEVAPRESKPVTIGGLTTTLEESVRFVIGPGSPEIPFFDGMFAPDRANVRRIRTGSYGGAEPQTDIVVHFSSLKTKELSSWATGQLTAAGVNPVMPYNALPTELKEAVMRALDEVSSPTGNVDFCP